MALSCLYLLGFTIVLLLNISLAAAPLTAGCTFTGITPTYAGVTGSIQLLQPTGTSPTSVTVYVNGGTAGHTIDVETRSGAVSATACTGGASASPLTGFGTPTLGASGNVATGFADSTITLASGTPGTYVIGQTFVVFDTTANTPIGCCTIAPTNDFLYSLLPPALNTGTYLLIALASVLVGSIILICIFLALCR